MALPGELSDAEVFGASQPGPVGRAFAPPGELTDAEVFGAPPPPAAPPPAPALPEGTLGVKSIADALVPSADTANRFWVNAKDAFQNTIVGETLNRVRSGQTAQTATDAANRALREAEAAGSPVALDRFADGTPSPYAQMPLALVRTEAARGQQMADERRPVYEADRAARVSEFEALRPWHQADGIANKATSGVAALFGQLAGSLPSPENLIGGPGTRVARGAGEAVLPFVVRNMGVGAGEAAAANVVANPVVQSGQVQRGEKPEFSTEELGESVLLGAGAGGTLRLAGMGWRALRDALGRQRGVDPNTITPDQVTPDDARAVAQIDPEFKAFAEANGIDLTATTPDPRVAVLEDRLAKRRALEANRPEPGVTPPPESVAAIFAENQRRAGEGANLAPDDAVPTVRPLPVVDPDAMGPASGGVARAFTSPVAPEGTIHPSASGLKARDRISDPILIDRQGGAFVADDGNVAGRGHAGVIEAGERKSVADVFRLAERQRERVGPEIRDTQTAGRPLGLDDSPTVRLDGEQPVRVVDVDPKGRPVVEPYDPRTGEVTGDRYVATGKLRDVRYSPEPRMAQDFVERAQGPKPPELPRGTRDPVIRQPQQTYRAGEVERPPAVSPERPAGLPPAQPQGALPAPAPKAIAGATPEATKPLALPGPERRPALPAPAARESYEAMLERFRKEEGVAIGGMQRYRTSRQRAEETARMRAYREDGGAAEVDAFVRDNGGIEFDHSEVFQHYRRADGETPQQAAERAVERWVELEERRAIQDYDARSSESLDDPIDFSTPLERTDPATEAAARLDRETFDESFAERNHGGRQEDGSGQAGTAGEAGGQGGRPGERPGARQEASPDGASDALRRPDRDAPGEAGRDAGGQRNDGEVGPGAGGRQDGDQGRIPGTERTEGRPADQAAGRVKPPQEPPPKGGLFDDDARNQIDLEDAIKAKRDDPGSTLSANPFANPAAWKALFKSPGAFSEKWLAGVADLFDSIREGREQGAVKKTNAAADVARGFFRSVDGEWRALAGKYKSDVMEEVRRLFHARPDVGRGGPVPQTYHEAVLDHGQGNINKAADILKPFVGAVGNVFNLTLAKDRVKFDQIVKLVENPRSIRPGTPIHDAAASLKKLIDGQHAYLTGAGVDMGKIEGYFPHMVKESAVRRAPDEFVAMAAKEYLRHGLAANPREARAKAEAWKDHILLQEVGVKENSSDFVTLGGAPNADFAKERTLVKKSPDFFNRFYHTDPVDSLTTYFQRTARRAEWSRRMGDDMAKWKDYKQRMIDEGNAAAIPQLVDLIAASAGVTPSRLSDSTKTALSAVRLWGMVSLLPRAYLTSLSEIAMVGVRSGDMTRALPDIARAVRGMFGGMKKEKALAEDVGLIAAGYGDTLLGQRYFGLDAKSKAHQWVANSFFKATLLSGLTDSQTKVAVNGAQTFIRRMALDVADANSRGTLSTKLLNELGVKDVDGFSQWALRHSKGRPTVDDVRDGSAHAAAYRTAVMRFVNQTIMRPNAQTFTRFASHPVGSLLMQLQSFNYAFTNNVLARIKNLAVESARPGSGLSAMERAKLWGPAMSMIPLVAIAAAVSEGRDEVFGNPNAKPKEDWEKTLRVASRSGLTGTLDPYINLFTSARYRTEAASMLAGPVAGKIAHDVVDAGRDMLPKEYGGPNSDRTNTAERNLAQSFYELVLAPALTVAALPLPAAIRTPGIQALGLGSVKEGVVTELAGPKEQRGGRGPARPARPQRAQR